MNSKLASLAITALASITLSAPAFADNASKEAKLRKLATLGGIATRIDEEVAQALAQARQTEQQMMSQVNSQLDPSPAFQARFDAVNKKFIDALQPQWTTFEIIEVYVKAYAPMVSEEDVDAALAYVGSDAGRRNAEADKEAARQIAALVNSRMGDRVPLAIRAYMAEMQATARECNCPRKPAGPLKQ